MTLASPDAPVRIQVCGQLAVERDGQRLDAALPGRQGRLMFAYLVVNRYRPVPRCELAEALWREPDPAAVDARLNPLLSKLRKVSGPAALTAVPPCACACRAYGSTSSPRPRRSTEPSRRSSNRTGRGPGDRR